MIAFLTGMFFFYIGWQHSKAEGDAKRLREELKRKNGH